jgi:hypothetical protein
MATTVTLSDHLDAASAVRLGLSNRDFHPGEEITVKDGDARSLFAAGYVAIVGAVTGNAVKPAWQFSPEDYGAKGDGKMVGNVAVTNGSAVITSASGPWTSADVGKHIMITGGFTGNTNIPLITTIASYQSATQVTLAASAQVTATGLPAIWGTDDTAAIQAAIDAARDYAVAHEYFGEVVFADRYYVLTAAPTQTANSPAYYNTQLKIPYAPDNTERKLIIALTGVGDVSHFQFWQSSLPNIAGTCLVSMQTGPATLDPTYGPQSVLGGPGGYAGFPGNFVNVKAIVQNLSVVCPTYTNLTAFDLSWISAVKVDGCSAHIFATGFYGGGTHLSDMVNDGGFGSRQGVGLRTPVIGNNADVWIPSFMVEGYTYGIAATEHVRIGNLKTIYNFIVINMDLGQGLSNLAHGLTILGWTGEAYQGGIRTVGTGFCDIEVNLSTEFSGGAYDVSDGTNALHGTFRFNNGVDNRAPVISGAANLKVINNTLGPGRWTGQPAVPASNTVQQNTAWRDAMVVVSGGTGVTIQIDGTTLTGVTSGAVLVPSGKTIRLTYTAAPTWTWWLL